MSNNVIGRIARLGVIALVTGVGISQLIFTLADWHLRDAGAYWEAALRLRAGEPLYPRLADPESSEVYRYSPWFAWAWIPLTFLPRELAFAMWSVVLLASSAAALYPLIERRAWLAVALFLPILVGISAIGNVQPLIIAALVLGLERRSGPLWIAMAASLKAVPILFVVTYIGRRQWRRAVTTCLITTVLVAPMVLHDLSNYPTSPGTANLLPGGLVVYTVVVAAAIVASARLAGSRVEWLASAATVAVAVPRFFVYDVTFLMAAVPRRAGEPHDRRS